MKQCAIHALGVLASMALEFPLENGAMASAPEMVRDTGLRILHSVCDLALVTFLVGSLWLVRLFIKWGQLPPLVQEGFEYVHIAVSFTYYLLFATRSLMLIIGSEERR